MKKSSFILCFLFCINLVFAQYTLIEKVSKQKNEFESHAGEGLINFSKYELKNGLTVIINENHSDPVVSVNVGYRFGSGNDQADRTGISYLVMKLMQSGTKHVGKGWYENYLKQYGGRFTADITRDYTTFISTAPVNLLETILWAESDRMACFTDSITEEKYLNVREELTAFVKNTTFNNPYGPLENYTLNSLYMYGYPYAWPVYGMSDHLNVVDINDLMKYVLDWYGPNNAVLVISGDVTPETAINMVDKYFGKIPSCPNTKPHQNPYSASPIMLIDKSIPQSRFVSYEYSVKTPMLRILFPTVEKFNYQEFFFNVIADLLAGDTSSILTRTLMKEKLALSVKAYQNSSLLTGEFIIDIVAPADTSLAKVRSRTEEIITSLLQKLTTDQKYGDPVINKYFFSNKINFLKSLETSAGVVNDLFISEVYFGNANSVNKSKSLNNYISLPKLLQSAMENFLHARPALYISVVPYNKTALAAATDNYKPMVLSTIITHTSKDELKFRTMASSYNKKMPVVKKLKSPELPSYIVNKYDNGLTFISIPDKKLQLATLKIYINLENTIPESSFYPYMTIFTEILKELFYGFHHGENNNMMIQTGGHIRFYTEGTNSIIEFQALSQDIFILREAFVHMFREQILLDQFNIGDINLEILKRLTYNNIPDIMALNTFRNIFAKVKENETPEVASDGVAGKFASKIEAHLGDILIPKNITFVISGNYQEPFLDIFIEPFKTWQPVKKENIFNLKNTYNNPTDSLRNVMPDKATVYILDNADVINPIAITGFLNVTEPFSPNFYINDFAAVSVKKMIDEKIINTNFKPYNLIRYSTNYLYFSSNKLLYLNSEMSPFFMDTTFRKTISVILKIKDFSINKNEVKKLKNSYYYNGLTDRETNDQKADLIYYINKNGLSNKYYTDRSKKIKSLKNKQLTNIVRKNYDPSKIKMLIIGNEIKFSDKLKTIDKIEDVEFRRFEIDPLGHILN